MGWLRPRRTTEGLADSIGASGAAGYGYDGIDEDLNYRRAGTSRRDVPEFTVEKARTLSVHGYRTNPMARAIVDTYTSFAVGDVGVSLTCTVPEVRAVAERFWKDPANALEQNQEMLFRSHLLLGETALELMVGPMSGFVRYAYITPEAITSVACRHGNPLWPERIHIAQIGGQQIPFDIVQIDDITELRTGNAMFWADWRAVATDRRGFPFLAPVLDWLDAYDQILWNLIDRTALARFMVFDVTVDGSQKDVDDFIARRGGSHAPRSGSVEVHNSKVTWATKNADAGAYEDKQTAATAMTNIAAGTGLAKTWLAEPEDANRATSLTMAEPVRRRVGGVQKTWLGHQTELVRYQIDQAVRYGRLPRQVAIIDERGDQQLVNPADTVRVTGPDIAASDAAVNATILVSLSQALGEMRTIGALSEQAVKLAARKAWEGYMGVPYSHELDKSGDVDEIEGYLEEQATAATGGTP